MAIQSIRARCRLAAALAAITYGGVGITAAFAQGRTDDQYGASVTSRENARAGGTPLRFGGLIVSPQVDAEITYDDNIFATDTDRRSDAYLVVRPELFISSDWGRHALGASAFVERTFYNRFDSEETTNYGVLFNGRYDVSQQTKIVFDVAAERRAENRSSLSSFFNSGDRVQYNNLVSSVGIQQQFGSLRLSATGRVRRTTYDDVALADGSTLDQTFRNLKVISLTLEAGYDLNTLTQFVVNGSVEQRRYDLRPGDSGFDPLTRIDRSGDSIRIEGGIRRELTRLLIATARVGYLRFSYPDPQLNDITGLSYYGNVAWNVTPLTTVNATASRRVDETSSPLTAGNLRDEVEARVDHELLRTLVLTGRVRYAWIDPSVVSSAALINTRSSREQGLDLEARYYFGRQFRLEGRYAYDARQSDDRFIAYRANRFTIGFNVAY